MSYQLIHGSAHSLPQIADKSVHMIATSPPYYGLRAYAGEQAIEWPAVEYAPMAGLAPIRVQGCEPGCAHEWANGPVVCQTSQDRLGNATDPRSGKPAGGKRHGQGFKTTQGAYCIHCGGWRGGLGLEPTIEAYIGHLILCLREWHRILRDDACVFVNLGDSYNGSGGAGGDYGVGGLKEGQPKYPGRRINGLKAKDLCMIPARFAIAAQADGWYLRSAIVWAKGVSFIPHYAGSCMPESVLDRPTQSYEMVYMLAKQERYFYDAESVKEVAVSGTDLGLLRGKSFADPVNVAWHAESIQKRQAAGVDSRTAGNGTRNLRNTWVINPQAFSGSHFACWPEALVTPMIKASTSAYGVCAKCQAPWARVVEREKVGQLRPMVDSNGVHSSVKYDMAENERITSDSSTLNHVFANTTTGWQPTCQCACDEVIPATVLDPFVGSGTSIKAAIKLGRNAIGVDISDSYLGELVPERTSNVQMEMQL